MPCLLAHQGNRLLIIWNRMLDQIDHWPDWTGLFMFLWFFDVFLCHNSSVFSSEISPPFFSAAGTAPSSRKEGGKISSRVDKSLKNWQLKLGQFIFNAKNPRMSKLLRYHSIQGRWGIMNISLYYDAYQLRHLISCLSFSKKVSWLELEI